MSLEFCATDDLFSEWSDTAASERQDTIWIAEKNRRLIVEFIFDSSLAVSSVAEATLSARFREHAEKWDNETAHLSSPAQRFIHPSYVAIMGMAQDHRDEVVSLLLRDMEENRREWFWALSYITHENPIDKRDSGSLDKMIRAWVKWGRKKGLR